MMPEVVWESVPKSAVVPAWSIGEGLAVQSNRNRADGDRYGVGARDPIAIVNNDLKDEVAAPADRARSIKGGLGGVRVTCQRNGGPADARPRVG